MRSVIALAALALVGSFDLAAAKKTCKPRSSTLATAGGQGSTGITTAPSSTTTPGGGLAPRGVRNIVVNGNFVGYDPSAPGGIYGFETDGDARQVSGIGYTGDGDGETGCVYFSVPDSRNTTSAISKRDGVESPQVANIRQYLQETDRESVYTMRVWYYVDYNALASTCKLVATYDNNLLVESPYFPVVEKDSYTFSWSPLIQESPVISSNGYLKFEVQCVGGGAAGVRFDQVFFTNEVSLRDLNDITVIYSLADTPTVAPTISSTAPVIASTTSAASTAAQSTSAASSPATTTQATNTGSQVASSTSSSPPAASSVFGDNTCVVLNTTPMIAGRGCAKRPYSGSSGYKTFPNPDITKEQCGALCLNDSRCQSFQYSSMGSGCQNYCSLLETSLSSGSPDNGGSGSPWAYDKSCIYQSACSAVPADNVCVNGQANTPGAGCTQFQGVPKSCATPFQTASMSMICGVGNGCRDLCAQTPSCKSYSYTYDSSNNCKLYSESAATVGTVQGSGNAFFADASCAACGTGMAQFKYLPKLSDPANMPVLNCPDPSASPVSTLAPTTTSSSPSTTSACPQYVNAPGMCYTATPTAVGSVCNKSGTNTNKYTKSLDELPRQDMDYFCGLACDSDPECKSYAWDPTLAPFNCQFSKSTITDNIATDAFMPSNMVSQRWYDMGCTRCVHCGAQPSSSSLLVSTTSSTTALASTTTGASSPSSTGCIGGRSCTAVLLAPAGTICKQQGDFSDDMGAMSPDPVRFPNKGASAEECASICSQTTNCLASSFSATSGCGLITSTLAAAKFVVGKTSDPTVWSDQACFTCGACGSSSAVSSTAASSSTAIASTTSTAAAAATSTGSSLASPTTCFGLTCQVKSPVATKVYCKTAGTFNAAYEIAVWEPDTTKFPLMPITVEQCAAVCLQDSRCKASAMTTRGRCQLFDQTLDTAKFVPTSVKGGDVWSDNACFDCTSCSSTSSSAPLLSSTVPSSTVVSTPSVNPSSTGTPLSTKTPVSGSFNTFSTPTTFDTRTTPASSSTDLNLSTTDQPIITPYPPMTGTATTTAPSSTTSAPVVAQTCTVPVAVVPDDATCGIPGNGGQQLQSNRLEDYVIKPSSSLTQCATDCLAKATCLGFSYTRSDTTCRLYRRGPADLGITYVPGNTVRYYDRACFTCPS